jgi:hypothetical protein
MPACALPVDQASNSQRCQLHARCGRREPKRFDEFSNAYRSVIKHEKDPQARFSADQSQERSSFE